MARRATGKSFVGRFGVHIAVLRLRRRSGRSRRSASWSRRCATRTRSSPRAGGTRSPARRRPKPAGCRRPRRRSRRTASSSSRATSSATARRATISAFGIKSASADAVSRPARVADLGDGVTLQLNADGTFVLSSPKAFEGDRGQRVYYASSAPPRFTTENYETVLFSEGIGRSFINSLTVTIPATVIPIMIAAFAAYALAWMRFPGRALLIAVIIGLLVVPLQMSLIPLLKLYNGVGALLRRAVEDLSRHLAGAYRLRPALRHLSAAQLHGRPAARADGIGAHRRRQRLRDLHQDRAAAVVPGARLLRHLPVPVGMERPAGGDGFPRHRARTSSC